MDAKILITAQIRNIDIHLMQVSERGFKVVWTAAGTNVEGLLYKNYVGRCKSRNISPSSYYQISDGGTEVLGKSNSSQLVFVETTSAFRANRRFKEMCRAAQDPRIKFENIKP